MPAHKISKKKNYIQNKIIIKTIFSLWWGGGGCIRRYCTIFTRGSHFIHFLGDGVGQKCVGLCFGQNINVTFSTIATFRLTLYFTVINLTFLMLKV